MPMPSQCCQYADIHAFIGEIGNESATSAMTCRFINTSGHVELDEALAQSIRTECLACFARYEWQLRIGQG